MLISTEGHDSSRATQNMLTPVGRVSARSPHGHGVRAGDGIRGAALTDCLPEAPRGRDQDFLRDAVPVVLLEQLRVHAGERARLLHLEEGARGRPDEVL
jgi:hypothetical protein